MPSLVQKDMSKTLTCWTVLLGVLSAIGPTLTSAAAQQFSGVVKSGHAPISGATVNFYIVGNTGYGSVPMQLVETTSNTTGSFTISGYTCPPNNPETYLLARGGNAGKGSNTAIGLIALTGKCLNLHATSFITLNELTTVAAEWALTQFVDRTGANIGTSPGNATGLANAAAQASKNLVIAVGTGSSNSGVPAKFLPSGASCSMTSSPANCDALERLDALANILADCNSSSNASTLGCTSLFKLTATPTTGTTLAAAHQIILQPKRKVTAIWNLQQMSATRSYVPTLSSAPEGWELALLFTPINASFDVPVWVAVDGPGNVWIVNGLGNSVSELPAGNYNSGATNFNPAAAAFSVPFAVALDTAGDVFVANAANSSVGELPIGNFTAGATSLTPAGAALASPSALALDSTNNLWVANSANASGTPCDALSSVPPCGSISELLAKDFSADGISFAPPAAKFDSLETIAVDKFGDIWTSNLTSNSVSELAANNQRDASNFAPSAAALDAPVAIALDNSQNVWVVNQTGGTGCHVSPISAPCGSVSELLAPTYETAANIASPHSGIVQPNSAAVDSAGNVWVSNFRGGTGCNNAPPCGSVSELPAGNFAGGAVAFAPPGAAFVHPTLLALDASGNVWVTHFDGVSELLGAAAPVLTPIQACLKKGENVCRP
jgi:hypothetical protein